MLERFYFADSQQPPESPFVKGEFKRNKEAKYLFASGESAGAEESVPILIGTRMSEGTVSCLSLITN